MAHADWKRYYMVVYDRPYKIEHASIFKSKTACYNWLKIVRYKQAKRQSKGHPVPIGVVGIRGRKHNAKLQTWLMEHSR